MCYAIRDNARSAKNGKLIPRADGFSRRILGRDDKMSQS